MSDVKPAVSLTDALTIIAKRFDLDAEELLMYAMEDTLGGHWNEKPDGAVHPAPPNGISNKGIWEVEGQTLYALIRALKPLRIMEVGNQYYCSTAHICEAIKRNGVGHLWTIDIEDEPVLYNGNDAVATQIVSDLFWFNYEQIAPIGFVFEDSVHTPEMVSHVWRAFKDHGRAGAVIVSHDSEHVRVGKDVRAGIADAGITDYLSLLIEPADCGLALWMKGE